MSHVVTVDVIIQDLDALAAAAEQLGMEMVKTNQFRWFGRHMGDFPLPEGFKKEDMGKCEYALRVKGAGPEVYEVGIARRRDGKPGFVPLQDFWQGGYGLEEKIGTEGVNLKREYALAVAAKEMRRQGFRVSRQVDQKTGKPKLTARRTR